MTWKTSWLPSLESVCWSLTAVGTQVWCSVVLCRAETLSPAACTETLRLQSGQQKQRTVKNMNTNTEKHSHTYSRYSLCTCCSSRPLSSSIKRTLSLSSATRWSHSCCSLLLLSCSSLCVRSCSNRSSLCSLWVWTHKSQCETCSNHFLSVLHLKVIHILKNMVILSAQ